MQVTDRPEATAAPANDAAHAIFAQLRDWAIDLVFTCPGSTEAAVLDASLEFPDVRLILTTHESIAVSAADGYARITGRPAVAYLHANVGLANGVAHLTCASNAHSPVVILNGMKSTAIANRDGFTTSPFQQDYVRQLVKRSRVALKADGIPGDLSRTLQAAVAEPKGPVYLGLPQDLVDSPLPAPAPSAQRRRTAARRRPDPDDVAAAARRLAAGRAVTIVAGSEIAFSDSARDALTALAERLQAPVLLEDRRSLQAAAIPGDHPAFAGSYALAHPAVAGADVLLFAGMYSFVEFEEQRGPFQPPDAQIVHLCSDPAQIGKLSDVDVALTGNAELGLRDLYTALGPVRSDARAAHRASALAAHRLTTDARRAAQRARYAEVPIDPRVLVEALHELLPRDCIVLNDAVTAGSYLSEAMIADAAREHLTAAGGSLSWGMGAAIGVQLARPQARVIDVVGDGSFQFGIQALFTAAQLQLPITYVVIDNESYAAVRAALKRQRKGAREAAYPASDLRGPDIAAIARGFGAHAETIDRIADLRGALDRAFAATGPAVVVVKTDPAHTGP
jgi:thiamine pyrophosphate-dependent acetolactate synthase large subunit-like protein